MSKTRRTNIPRYDLTTEVATGLEGRDNSIADVDRLTRNKSAKRVETKTFSHSSTRRTKRDPSSFLFRQKVPSPTVPKPSPIDKEYLAPTCKKHKKQRQGKK
jgi:hypothetical protein